MSSLFGQVWFWSLLAFLVGAVLTWVLLVRPAQQRVQQLERQPRGGRPAPGPPTGQARPQQIPPRPPQQAGPPPPHTPYQQPPQPAWPGQQEPDPESTEHHPRTRWLERDSLDTGTQRGVAPEQPTQVPDQRPEMGDQRAFVPAEPPTPYGQQEDVQRELERQYREEFEREYPEDYQRDVPDDAAQGYPEDYSRDYPGDVQDYAPEYEREAYADQEEFTGRVHPTGYAPAADPQSFATPEAEQQAYEQRVAAWQEQPPANAGGRNRLGDIDEQPQLGDLGDLSADSDVVDQRAASAQRPGGLFEPSGSAERDTAYEDNGVSGYAAPEAQPAAFGAPGTADAPDTDTEAPDESSEPDTDPVTGLPRRRRGASNRIRGGFSPPRPIEPSIRPVTRRTPQQEGGSSGSLFEPSHGEQSGAVAQAGGHAEAEVPAGPFGLGSAMPLPGGGRPDPSFTVKASVTELRYCTEDSPQFVGMTPEVWFASASDAERVGFRPIP
ncbi:MAG: hypothetical protein GEV04_17780 [Actinophytocola sp.]|nr:hypothetical protein [Actinophytocola sp.]